MQRRGESGQPVKGQRTRRPKARKAPTARLSDADLQEQLERRTRERDEAVEQLTASAEVLTVMSHSAFDLQTVFDALVESATRLCQDSASVIWRPKNDGTYHLAASYGVGPRFKERLQSLALKSDGRSVVGRSLQSGKTT